MDDLGKLLAIEAIKAVKSRYFHGLDHKDWDLWRLEVWAPDGELLVPEHRPEPYRGVEEIIGWVRESVGDQVSVHHGHMPDIVIESDTTARATWAMEDRLYRTREFPLADGSTYLHGFGHYRERYVRLDRGWRLASSQLTRLRVEMRKVF